MPCSLAHALSRAVGTISRSGAQFGITVVLSAVPHSRWTSTNDSAITTTAADLRATQRSPRPTTPATSRNARPSLSPANDRIAIPCTSWCHSTSGILRIQRYAASSTIDGTGVLATITTSGRRRRTCRASWTPNLSSWPIRFLNASLSTTSPRPIASNSTGEAGSSSLPLPET